MFAAEVQSGFVLFLKRINWKTEIPFCIFISFADILNKNQLFVEILV